MSARFVPSTAPVLGADALWICIRGMDVLVIDLGDRDELPVARRARRARDHADALALPGRAGRRAVPLGRARPTTTKRPRAWRSARCATSTAASTRSSGRSPAARPSSSSGIAPTSTADAAARRPSMLRASARAAAPCAASRRFPRLSPAVIMRVTRGDEILLARALRFPGGCTACSRASSSPARRSRSASPARSSEEVGIEVDRHPLLLKPALAVPPLADDRVHGDWVSGDLRLEEAEIADAQWFTRDNLPELPGRLSIARKLIDDWL